MIYFSFKKSMLTSQSEQSKNEKVAELGAEPSPTETAVSALMLMGLSPGTEAPLHTGLRHSHLECGEPWRQRNLGEMLNGCFLQNVFLKNK